jgi:phage shock protein A
MLLIKRFSRLFQADLHAILDNVEEPSTLLKQAIREMEGAVMQDQQRLKLLEKELEQIQAKQADNQQSLTKIESGLDACFESENETLARSTIKRKLTTQRLLQALTRKHQSTQNDIEALKQRLRDNLARLDVMRQKLDILSEEATPALRQDTPIVADFGVTDDEVEVVFLQEKHQRGRHD